MPVLNKIAVLVSGQGRNLQAIIDACNDGRIPGRIVVVISNQGNAAALTRAAQAGISTAVLDPKKYADREAYDAALHALLQDSQPDLLVLAGFMRILTPTFVSHYAGRMLNIHPSLLPLYRGLHTHQRALDAGDKVAGASVHFVTEELDGGPVVLQAEVSVQTGDDAQQLADRVLARELLMFPLAVSWFMQGRLRCIDNQPWLDDAPLTRPIRFAEQDTIAP